MVHCPQCGAANPEKNKLCQECGAELLAQRSGARCPMCSHVNSFERETCEKCGARLVPLVAPSPPAPEDRPGQPLPPLPAAPVEPTAPPPPVPGRRAEASSRGASGEPQPNPSARRGEPDWLRQIRESSFTAPTEAGEPAADAEPAHAEVPPSGPDWLRRLDAPEALGPEVGEPEAEDTPDWLRRLESDSDIAPSARPEPVSPTSSLEADEETTPATLDWLSRIKPRAEDAVAVEEGRDIPTPSPEMEVPDWLAELAPLETEPGEMEPLAGEPGIEGSAWLAEAPGAGSTEGEVEVPDWLADLAPAEVEPGEEEVDLPDWLAQLSGATEEAGRTGVPRKDLAQPEEEAAPAPAHRVAVPDWLAELAPAEVGPVEVEEDEAAPAPAHRVEVPDWLAQLGAVEEAPEAAPQEEGEISIAEEGEVSEWLVELAPAEAEAGVAGSAQEEAGVVDWSAALESVETEIRVPDWLAEPEVAGAEPGEEELEVPNWLVELMAGDDVTGAGIAEKEEVPGALAGPALDAAGLVQAEIPAWLDAMRPGVAPARVHPGEDREVETSGLLAGIPGVVRPATAIIGPPAAPAELVSMSAEAGAARATLWQELIARTTQPSPTVLPRPQAVRGGDGILRWLLYAILLLSIAIPVVSDLDLSDIFAVDQPLTAEAAVTYRQIEEMPIAGEPVFVVFDYSPAFMGELQLQARALLQHLGQKDAQVVALSLTPEGAALAQQVLDDEDVNLGYLPGEAVAVRSLEFLEGQLRTQAFNGQDLKGTHVFDSEGLLTLSDSALIVLLTGDANNFRWWVEQTTALEKDLARNLPLVAGVSAAIGPIVRPYYEMESPQLDGLLVGLTGAADYELLLGSSQAPARVRLSGTLLGQLVVSGLILIGVVLYSFSRGGGPAEGQSR